MVGSCRRGHHRLRRPASAKVIAVKRLHLLRHAKSDWSEPGLADHDRPLNKRGKRARKTIAEHVAGWRVDLVVCSTAARARATAKPIVAELGCPVTYERAVYTGSAADLVRVVRTFPDDAHTVMLVGHNPSIEDLTELLCGTTPGYPTAALGTIELAIDHWSDVAPGSGTLTAHVTPATLDDEAR
jgi:phosphohistidine phosphatase